MIRARRAKRWMEAKQTLCATTRPPCPRRSLNPSGGPKPNFDILPRGFVGIETEDGDGGVVVNRVLADSPAAKAGLKPGDVIESVKSKAVTSGKELTAALAKAGVGSKWAFTVKRGGKTEELTVELGKGL